MVGEAFLSSITFGIGSRHVENGIHPSPLHMAQRHISKSQQTKIRIITLELGL
jgi:hypothetical protein